MTDEEFQGLVSGSPLGARAALRASRERGTPVFAGTARRN
jgi:hypothetical protein